MFELDSDTEREQEQEAEERAKSHSKKIRTNDESFSTTQENQQTKKVSFAMNNLLDISDSPKDPESNQIQQCFTQKQLSPDKLEQQTQRENEACKDIEDLDSRAYWKIIESTENLFQVANTFNSWSIFESKRPNEASQIRSEYEIPVIANFIVVEILSKDYKTSNNFYIQLFHHWTKLSIEKGDTLYVFGEFSPVSNCLVLKSLREKKNFSEINFAVICPEEKLAVTELINKKDCARYYSLKKFFTAIDPYANLSQPGVAGNIAHNLFEAIINMQDTSLTDAKKHKMVSTHLKPYIEKLYMLRKGENGVKWDEYYKECYDSLDGTLAWKKKYISTESKHDLFNSPEEDVRCKILGVDTTEKRQDSDKFGLVGYVDIVLSGRVVKKSSNERADTQIPFELKTGIHESEGYKGQVMLYLIMLFENDLRKAEKTPGFIYYNKLDKLIKVDVQGNAIYDLLFRRNEIVKTIIGIKRQIQSKSFELPKRIKNIDWTCTYCAYKNYCAGLAIAKTTKEKFSINMDTKNIDDEVALVMIHNNSTKKRAGVNGAMTRSQDSNSTKKGTEPIVFNNNALNTQPLPVVIEENKVEDPLAHITQICDIEDCNTEDEPLFKGFETYYKSMTVSKLKYLERWLELVKLEERQNFLIEHGSLDLPTQSFASSNNFKAESSKKFLFEFENYEEMMSAWNDKDAKANQGQSSDIARQKFGKCYEHESEATSLMEALTIGNTFSISHLQSNVTLYGTLVRKNLRKRKIGLNTYSYVYPVVKQNSYHVKMQFSKMAGQQYDEIISGWLYDTTRKYTNFNKMRGVVSYFISDTSFDGLSKFVIDLKTPRFEESEFRYKFEDDLGIYQESCAKHLNSAQIHAIERSVNAIDYNLILGMPGTGKTYTTAMQLKVLLGLNKRVLVSSYSYESLEPIILTFLSRFPKEKKKLRLMNTKASSMHKDIVSQVHDPTAFNNFQDIEKFLSEKKIFFGSQLSLTNPLLVSKEFENPNKKLFDYVIMVQSNVVIEALQMDLQFKGNKFIMIGDYYQSGPIVNSPEAREKKMGVSQFQRLCEAHQTEVSQLNIQYRMNEDIARLSSEQIYNFRLKTDDKVKSERLELKNSENDIEQIAWVKEIIFGKNSVVFIDIDNFNQWREQNSEVQKYLEKCYEQRRDDEVSVNYTQNFSQINAGSNFNQNYQKFLNKASICIGNEDELYKSDKIEEDLTIFLIAKLRSFGFESKDIALITTYNKERAYQFSKLENNDVDVLTIDKTQGKERDAIVVLLNIKGFTKESAQQSLERVNIAFTKAKKKLFIIGSMSQLGEVDCMQKIIAYVKKNHQVFDFEKSSMRQQQTQNNFSGLNIRSTFY